MNNKCCGAKFKYEERISGVLIWKYAVAHLRLLVLKHKTR